MALFIHLKIILLLYFQFLTKQVVSKHTINIVFFFSKYKIFLKNACIAYRILLIILVIVFFV